jgi:hypothetical protein
VDVSAFGVYVVMAGGAVARGGEDTALGDAVGLRAGGGEYATTVGVFGAGVDGLARGFSA